MPRLIWELLGVASMIVIASTTACELRLSGRKMMVNVDKGRPELIVTSGEPLKSRPSRNVRVYEEFATKSAAYLRNDICVSKTQAPYQYQH